MQPCWILLINTPPRRKETTSNPFILFVLFVLLALLIAGRSSVNAGSGILTAGDDLRNKPKLHNSVVFVVILDEHCIYNSDFKTRYLGHPWQPFKSVNSLSPRSSMAERRTSKITYGGRGHFFFAHSGPHRTCLFTPHPI